jgi:hypothetical protein
MRALVVYESLWGNTAAVARAIAEGLGPDARAVQTGQADPAAVAEADIVVAGAPVLGFSLPTEAMRESVRTNPGGRPPAPADLSQPSMRSWLDALPPQTGGRQYAAFESALRFSPGGAVRGIGERLERAGFSPAAKGERFFVTGRFGPLRDGELERARQWGARLAAGQPPRLG